MTYNVFSGTLNPTQSIYIAEVEQSAARDTLAFCAARRFSY